jgi:stress-induced morphogen
MVAQHKMVTALLREEIKAMHGLTLTTKASPPPTAAGAAS